MKNIKDRARKGGKLLRQATPLVGDLLDNLESEEGGKGKFAWKKLAIQIVRLGITIFLSHKGIDIML
jgi:hypothetical protein